MGYRIAIGDECIKMAFSHTATGATNQSSIVRGNVGFVSGVWDADSVTLGTITTGLSLVMAYGVENFTTEKGIKSKKNVDGSGAASNGSIGILAVTSDDEGDWWAIGLLSGTSVS